MKKTAPSHRNDHDGQGEMRENQRPLASRDRRHYKASVCASRGVRWQNSTGFGWDEKFAQFPQRDDDIQLYEARHREYNPGLGRWMSPDPMGMAATNPANPQSWNRYAYVLNNPTTLTDPLGLDPCGPGDTSTAYCEDVTATPPPDIPYYINLSNYEWSCIRFGGCGGESGGIGGWSSESGGGGGGGASAIPPKVTGTGTTPTGNPCASLGTNGGVVPLSTPYGQLRFQFNPQGALTGLGVQLTGPVPVTRFGFSIPANTFIGARLTPADSITIGFTNPVQTPSSYGVGAYIRSVTFSGSSFSHVNGAAAFLSIPFFRTTTSSSLLAWFLNRNSAAKYAFAGLLNAFQTASKNVGCSMIFGGGQ